MSQKIDTEFLQLWANGYAILRDDKEFFVIGMSDGQAFMFAVLNQPFVQFVLQTVFSKPTLGVHWTHADKMNMMYEQPKVKFVKMDEKFPETEELMHPQTEFIGLSKLMVKMTQQIVVNAGYGKKSKQWVVGDLNPSQHESWEYKGKLPNILKENLK